MTDYIVLPGIGGSGEAHWQTSWEKADARMHRFRPSSWDRPDLEDWIGALSDAVDQAPGPPVLVAHSLGCLLVAHWQAATDRHVRGALLVAVPDPDGEAFPPEAAAFGAMPAGPLRCPAQMLASTDDPYASIDYAGRRASAWRCELRVLGALGHVNGASGLGPWPEGRELLERFVATLR